MWFIERLPLDKDVEGNVCLVLKIYFYTTLLNLSASHPLKIGEQEVVNELKILKIVIVIHGDDIIGTCCLSRVLALAGGGGRFCDWQGLYSALGYHRAD